MKKSLLKSFLLILSIVSVFTLLSCSFDKETENACDLSGHKWDDGVITTPATKDKAGVKTFTCTICNEHKYETISMEEEVDNGVYEVKYTYYGSYPQTHVGDEMLISELNKLTETNDRGYYEYNGREYAKVKTSPCNYGTISYNDNQGDLCYTTFVYSDGATVYNDVVEWFIVEPIKWRILSENSNGSYQLYSEYILDTIVYFDGAYIRNINEASVYRNNYKYSNIRAWLNGYNGTDYSVNNYTNKGFYDLAFKESEKDKILITEIDNSANTSDYSPNQYACENTFDKIYLLSYKDLENSKYGFIDDLSRCAKVTDYAKAVGAYWETKEQYLDYESYWLRTATSRDANKSYFVQFEGNVLNYYVKNKHYGVRVACNVNLD